MPIEKIVINASPLILLCKADLEYLLPELFEEIVLPDSVRREISAGGDSAADQAANAPWLKHVTVDVSDDVAVWNLGDGESEVISFGLSHTEFRASIDDKAARNCARTLHVETLGTGGILVLAKRRSLIPSIDGPLTALRDSGLFISDDVIALLKQMAGE